MDFESAGVKLIEKACFSTIHVYFRVNSNMMKDIGHLVSVTFFRHSAVKKIWNKTFGWKNFSYNFKIAARWMIRWNDVLCQSGFHRTTKLLSSSVPINSHSCFQKMLTILNHPKLPLLCKSIQAFSQTRLDIILRRLRRRPLLEPNFFMNLRTLTIYLLHRRWKSKF